MPEPLYLLNSTTIINGSLNSIKPSDIKTIVVYKGGQEGPKELKNIGFRGIVDITSKKSVKGKPLAKVAAKQRLKGPVAFVLNGNRLDAAHVAALRIIPEAVGQIHVTPASVENPETIVSIRLAVAKAAEVPSDGKLRIMIR